MRPQALLSCAGRGPGPDLAGLPSSVRAAAALASLEIDRLLLCPPPEDFLRLWSSRLSGSPWVAVGPDSPALRECLAGDRPALVLSDDAIASPEALRAFLLAAASRPGPTVASDARGPLAAYYPDPAALRDALPPKARELPPSALLPAPAVAYDASDWPRASDPSALRRAEAALFDSLRNDSDGYLARLDRQVSIAVSRRLLRLPVTPNQITTASLLVGLFGAWLLAGVSYRLQLLGAALLWFCCILDGCDGEIARLKLLSSSLGGRYDVIADNIVHLAVFVAIPVHMQRRYPQANFLLLGTILVAGVLLSMFWVWRLILRSPERGPLARVFERIASRDFIYLVLALAVAGRLDLFLRAAAVGSHVFWISLLAMAAFWTPKVEREFRA